MKEIFDRLIYTLGCIEVHGEENMDMLLGCIKALKQLKSMVKTERREIKPEEEEENGANQDQQGKGA